MLNRVSLAFGAVTAKPAEPQKPRVYVFEPEPTVKKGLERKLNRAGFDTKSPSPALVFYNFAGKKDTGLDFLLDNGFVQRQNVVITNGSNDSVPDKYQDLKDLEYKNKIDITPEYLSDVFKRVTK